MDLGAFSRRCSLRHSSVTSIVYLSLYLQIFLQFSFSAIRCAAGLRTFLFGSFGGEGTDWYANDYAYMNTPPVIGIRNLLSCEAIWRLSVRCSCTNARTTQYNDTIHPTLLPLTLAVNCETACNLDIGPSFLNSGSVLWLSEGCRSRDTFSDAPDNSPSRAVVR
ncbi:hypothetical protein GQ44DRAFT_376948 [Phaeosphaeriaceae sp. PMI808]|nr:hypothetical protein GQ44DRAFT_376948 [Phaeosphaeriaceae sp. PMI808]